MISVLFKNISIHEIIFYLHTTLKLIIHEQDKEVLDEWGIKQTWLDSGRVLIRWPFALRISDNETRKLNIKSLKF
ncbi:MAG TPA: hypothetical protein VK213_07515 [Bacteroidales bacterium]|nr:hypothetical protein [Bacteroidales bacterium]